LESSSMSSSQGAMWMKSTQKSENHLTFSVPATDGPIEVKSIETLVQEIDGKRLAFLDDLDVQEGSLINQIVKELHESHSKTVQGPGMALAIIVAVVVTCCTGGSGGTLLAGALGSLMGGGAVGSTLGVICAAAINAGITNHILDTMSNGGDVFKAFAKGVSKERLKDAAVSGISAGITHGVDQGLTKVFGDVSKMTTLGQHARSATNKVVSLGARTGFESLVRGTDFKDGFVDGLKHIGAEVALDGLIEGASSLASNDNVPSSSTPTVSKKPEVKGTLESFGNHVQQSGARMARGLTVNLLAGDNPRDVVIKTIAAFAAEVVCFGVAEGYQGFTGILGDEDDHEIDDLPASAMPSPQPNGRSREELVASLHSIIDGIQDEGENPEGQRRTREEHTCFEGESAPHSNTLASFFEGVD